VRRISRFVRDLSPDIVHAHGTEESYTLAAQAVGKPSLITAQGCFFVINREMPPKLISRERIVQFTEWLAFKRAKYVIAKSPYIKNELARTFPHLALHEIPNTFDPALLDIALPKCRRGIAFVGAITPRKGLDCLADALEILKSRESEGSQNSIPASQHPDISGFSIQLHIIGNETKCPSAYEQSIILRFHSILGENLILHGRVPTTKAAGLVAQCEILVAPSIEEMFGNQVIEALLVGTWPVVSSGTAMEDNVIQIGAGSVFKNGGSADLASQILWSLDNINEWDRLATQQRVDEFFGPVSVARAHQELYRTLGE
jgi:glycosyltransferase involved in cell wall biosynthesis